MARTTKIMGFSVPPTLVKEVETLARQERRTKSELFREMVRVYHRYRDQRDRDESRWIKGVIDDAEAEQKKNPMSTEDLLKETERRSRSGARQAKKLGIKPKDVDRILHDYRARRPSGNPGYRHPYVDYAADPVWPLIEKGIDDLVKNKDLIEQTDRSYVVGYLCKVISKGQKARALPRHSKA